MGMEDAAVVATQETSQEQQGQTQEPAIQQPAAAEILDPVARELAEVNAALAAEESAAAGKGEGGNQDDQQAQQPAATPAAPAKPADAKGDPTAAIIALRRANQELHQKLMLATGQNQALMAVATAKGGEPVAEPQPGSEQPAAEPDTIDKVRAERMALAEQFDAGEISAKDMEAQRQKLDDREWGIRQAMLAPAPVQQSDLHLEQATAKLETDYPVLKILSAQDLAPLAALARIQAAREGTPIQPGAVGTLDLRTRIAKLAHQHFGGGAAAATTTPTKPAGLSEDALARAAKLELASRMPPDATNLGSAASDVAMSESEILSRMEGMSEEEQWALMKTLPGSVKTALGRF